MVSVVLENTSGDLRVLSLPDLTKAIEIVARPLADGPSAR